MRKQHLQNYFDQSQKGYEYLQYKTFGSNEPDMLKDEFNKYATYEKLGGMHSTLHKMKYDLMDNEMSNFDRNWTGINDRYR